MGSDFDEIGSERTPHGRFIELRVRLLGSCPGADPPTSPTLCDIHVGHGLGDLNCDGNLNNFDIDAFVVALTESEETYNSLYPNCDRLFADIDGNGLVHNFDIDAFVQALADPSAYEAAHPDCDRMLADIDGNGLVNNFDTDPFVELLANSCYGAE